MTDADRTLHVQGDMNIYRAAELKQMLLEALDAPGSLTLDLSGVTECDSAGLQLLVLAGRQARDAGCALHLKAPSAAVSEVLELLRLTPMAEAGRPLFDVFGDDR